MGKGKRDKGGDRALSSWFHHGKNKRKGMSLCSGLAVVFFWLLSPGLQGADVKPTSTENKESHKSSLGVPYVEIAETTVLFARWETRVSDFETFVKETKYGWNEKAYFPQTGDHPVVNVNLQDAVAFCEWLTKRERASGAINEKQSYRLPTNGEWDLVSGVVIQTDLTKKGPEVSFPWGKEWPPLPQAGNFNSLEMDGTDDGFAYTAPVGSFQPGKQGLDDLAGNVWEWTLDGSAGSGDAILRGASWQYFNKECLQSGYHYVVSSKLRRSSIGFRCVFDDKSRAETLLALQKRKLQEKGEALTVRTKTTKEEVEQLKNKMLEKSGLTAEEKLAAKNRLLNEHSGSESFVNSLGITFKALPDGSGLLSTRELRAKDLTIWASMTGKKLNASIPIDQTEATAFCEWLAARERTQNKIAEKADYRLATEAERIAVAGFGVREEQDFRIMLINQHP